MKGGKKKSQKKQPTKNKQKNQNEATTTKTPKNPQKTMLLWHLNWDFHQGFIFTRIQYTIGFYLWWDQGNNSIQNSQLHCLSQIQYPLAMFSVLHPFSQSLEVSKPFLTESLSITVFMHDLSFTSCSKILKAL